MHAKKEGFSLKRCTLEHPARNVSAERFMSVIVKVVHAVVAEGKDPKMNLWKGLRNYRNTPHPSTGKKNSGRTNNGPATEDLDPSLSESQQHQSEPGGQEECQRGDPDQ